MPSTMQPPKDAPAPQGRGPETNIPCLKRSTIPAKYKVAGTSGLTWDIKAGKNTKDFDLTD